MPTQCFTGNITVARGAGKHPRIVLTTHGEGVKEPLKQRRPRVLTSPHSTNDSDVFSHLRGNKTAPLLRNRTTRTVLLTETSGARRSTAPITPLPPNTRNQVARGCSHESAKTERLRERKTERPRARNPRGQGPASLHPSSQAPAPTAQERARRRLSSSAAFR